MQVEEAKKGVITRRKFRDIPGRGTDIFRNIGPDEGIDVDLKDMPSVRVTITNVNKEKLGFTITTEQTDTGILAYRVDDIKTDE